MIRRLACLLGWLILAAAPAFGADEPSSENFFETNIRPLLIERCVKCHGSAKAEGDLRLDAAEGLFQGGDRGPAVVPGQPDASLLVQAIRHEDELEMPPDSKLAGHEIEALEAWIRAGAKWPDGMQLTTGGAALRGGPITDQERGFWAFQPLADAAPPRIEHEQIRNPIDQFVLAGLRDAGLEPAGPATRRELIRRATFDLTGLPPKPEEIEAFLADDSPDAFARVVDRLLETRGYGERWGRHWLDVVRYADTAGETGDYPTPLSYKYRNWVIRALNQDLPYDEFVRHQIAGDIIGLQNWEADPQAADAEELYREALTATGFIAISRRFGFDVENYHNLTIQDTIDTVGQAFLGLSLGCARCHDHKYDPVNLTDYYAWYGIFESTRYSFPGSEEKKRSYDLFPTLPPQQADRLKAEHDAKLKALQEEQAELQKRRDALATQLPDSQPTANFFGFELQTINQPLSSPFDMLGKLAVTEAAQSPYSNAFPEGTRGVEIPQGPENNAFGIGLLNSHSATLTPRLYYNVDFRHPKTSEPVRGAYRFYLGRGKGESAAVEFAAGQDRFFIRNGGQYQQVTELRPDHWYNVQATVDLRTKRYWGTIGDPEQRVEFSGTFSPGWDGTIDRTFIDKYGAAGGSTPGRQIDNLSISTTPFLPVNQQLGDHPEQIAKRSWKNFLDQRRVTNLGENHDGHPGFHVWHGSPLPTIGYNATDGLLKVPGDVRPGKVVAHPAEQEGIGVAWKSPFSGKVSVSDHTIDAHNCGDSVLWYVDHLAESGFVAVAEGSTPPNGEQRFSPESNPPLTEISVQQGEFLQLAILPKTNYGCDLTELDFQIEEVGGARRWNLTEDIHQAFTSGNPLNDQYDNTDIWHFFRVAEDRGQGHAQSFEQPAASLQLAELQKEADSVGVRLAYVEAKLAELQASPPYDVVYAAIDKAEVADSRIQIRGDKRRLGDEVPRKNLEILGNQPLTESDGSGRRELAQWLTSDENPIFARVMANRIWQHHFGRGLVSTENDFGARGAPPSHPELLDWLACRFRESNYSLKALHRLIMASATYQRSSRLDKAAAEQDPQARTLWRFNPRRLSAEEIRDAMLLVSGDLDPEVGGEHPFPAEDSWSFSQHAPFYGVYETNKRSIYLMQQRLKRHPFLALFDGADPNVSTARRELTTVPTQALYLMNNTFVHDRSQSLARRLLAGEAAPEDRIRHSFLLALGREPQPGETADALDFVATYRNALREAGTPENETKVRVWSALARNLLTRNEFLFVD